ncbi:MAG TPA: DUF3035 domain-containing protein [Thermohalobaculum sp.]|nr:DUF3035 domain-containing protein [Thermohalobaculum sp.]
MMVTSGVRRLGRAGMVLAVLTLAGCGTFGNPLKAIRGNIPPPDEFQVIARKPLQMPAGTDLPEPTPGVASPLDPDPHADAVRALLGESAAAGGQSAATSPGEGALLTSADAAAASSEVRVQLEEDKVQSAKKKPYKPPTLAELLGFSDGKPKVDEKELLDPVAESQRLQTEGVVAPADPDAEPEEKEASGTGPAYSVYPQGRPQRDPITNKGLVPVQ